MSLVKDAIRQLVDKGKMSNSFKVQGISFEMEAIKLEEQLISDSMIDIDNLRKKYDAEKHTAILPDVIAKFRSISQVAFAIKTVNGESPVDEKATFSEQFKQRLELRDELMELDTNTMDELIKNYRALMNKQKAFFDNAEENIKKS